MLTGVPAATALVVNASAVATASAAVSRLR